MDSTCSDKVHLLAVCVGPPPTQWPPLCAALARVYGRPRRPSPLRFSPKVAWSEPQSMQQLWEVLPSWEQLGSDALMEGCVVPELVKVQALYKLVPQEQQSVIVRRPERADYNAKLLWVKAQMEHERGATQAQPATRRFHSIREVSRAISVVAPPKRMRQAGSWWRRGRRQRGEWRDHGNDRRLLH